MGELQIIEDVFDFEILTSKDFDDKEETASKTDSGEQKNLTVTDFEHNVGKKDCKVELSENILSDIGKPKKTLLEQFFRLYRIEFNKEGHKDQFYPIENYIEETETTYFIICKEKSNDKVVKEKSNDKVVGGIIFEYYPISECGLLSYIFVDPDEQSNKRGLDRGIGEFLINDGIKEVVESIKKEDSSVYPTQKNRINAVFFETENPLFHKDNPEELKTIFKRLRFFKDKANAKHIDIPYVQPPIQEKSGENNSVYSLYLMVLPEYGKIRYGAKLNASVVMKFLLEYYEYEYFLKIFSNYHQKQTDYLNKKINELNELKKSDLSQEEKSKIEGDINQLNSEIDKINEDLKDITIKNLQEKIEKLEKSKNNANEEERKKNEEEIKKLETDIADITEKEKNKDIDEFKEKIRIERNGKATKNFNNEQLRLKTYKDYKDEEISKIKEEVLNIENKINLLKLNAKNIKKDEKNDILKNLQETKDLENTKKRLEKNIEKYEEVASRINLAIANINQEINNLTQNKGELKSQELLNWRFNDFWSLELLENAEKETNEEVRTQEYFKALDLFRIEVCLKIADVLEDLDPIGLLDKEDALRFYRILKKIEQDFVNFTKPKSSDNGEPIIDKKKPQDDKEAKIYEKKLISYKNALEEHLNNQIYEENINAELDDMFYLKEVPTFKVPSFEFRKCSVALHIVENNDTEEEIAPVECQIMYSYESDCLAQRYEGHKNMPFQSRCADKGEVTIWFKNNIEFTSEGRKENYYFYENYFDKETNELSRRLPELLDYEKKCQPNKPKDISVKENADPNLNFVLESNSYSKKARYFLNYTYFHASKKRVWELIFSPLNEEKGFTEFELIQLSKYFVGRQEKVFPVLNFWRKPVSSDKKINESTDSNEKESAKHKKMVDKKRDKLFTYLSTEFVRQHQSPSLTTIFEHKKYRIKSGTIQIGTESCLYVDKHGFKYKFSDEHSVIEDKVLDETKEKPYWKYVYENIRIAVNEEVSPAKEKFEERYGSLIIKPINFNDGETKKTLIENCKKNSDSGFFDSNIQIVEFKEKDDPSGKDEKLLEKTLDTLCGISIGIFDYDRMDVEEVYETLVPIKASATSTSLHFINRGSLVYCSHEEDLYDSVLQNIGITPYILFVNTVLAHNFRVSRSASNSVTDFLEKNAEKNLLLFHSHILNEFLHKLFNNKFLSRFNKNFPSPDKITDFKSISEKRKGFQIEKDEIEDKLTNEIVSNVFHYPSDREMFDKGMSQRGLNSLIDEIRSQNTILESRLSKFSSWLQELFQLKITLIGVLLAFISLKSLFISEEKPTLEKATLSFSQQIYKFLYDPFNWITGAFIICLVIIYYRRKINLIKE